MLPALRKFLLTIQLTLPRAAVGMLSAILTSNFNRITIYEMGVAAIIVTTMLGIYQLMSPFQVIFGRLADRFPIFGYRRSPYILAGLTLSAVIVACLPPIAAAMGAGQLWAFFIGFLMLILFGLGFCISGPTHLSLIADVVPSKSRGLQMALTWIMLIVSGILTLQFLKETMPTFDYSVMQKIYMMFVPVVFIFTLLGLIGVEKRITPKEHAENLTNCEAEEKTENFLFALWKFVVDSFKVPDSRNFFFFIFFAMFGIFLQENILEVFGAEVMNLTVGETGNFQQIWGIGGLGGMLLMGILTRITSISKLTAIVIGICGVATSFSLLAFSSISSELGLVMKALFAFGFFNGCFTVGTLSAMLDMTTEKDRGAFMGLWGLSLAYAMGFGSIIGGALVSGLIETNIMTAANGYAFIFVLEAGFVLLALYFVLKINRERFADIDADGMAAAMEADAG